MNMQVMLSLCLLVKIFVIFRGTALGGLGDGGEKELHGWWGGL